MPGGSGRAGERPALARFADLFIMHPHPDHLNGFDILENLVDKTMLDIYSS
jgi:phosphoribosyl 1,2-cyclic phosphodiesterase